MLMTKRIFAVLGICAILCLPMFLFTTDAAAQSSDTDNSKNLDKTQAQKQGVSGALATRPGETEKDPTSPSRLQMGVGIGSVIVMFAVMKWL